MDDIKIYNTTLSSAEVNKLYQSEKDGLVAYYPFNGNASDESGNGYDGTEFGGVAPTTDRFGNADSAYSFDGVDDFVTIPSAPFNFSSQSALTVSAWVKNFTGERIHYGSPP